MWRCPGLPGTSWNDQVLHRNPQPDPQAGNTPFYPGVGSGRNLERDRAEEQSPPTSVMLAVLIGAHANVTTCMLTSLPAPGSFYSLLTPYLLPLMSF